MAIPVTFNVGWRIAFVIGYPLASLWVFGMYVSTYLKSSVYYQPRGSSFRNGRVEKAAVIFS